MSDPHYFHAPLFPSRTAVLDVGLKCTHSCRFCYYSFLDGSDDQFHGMRHANFRTGEVLKQVLRQLAASGFLAFDITGGEPTLHPDLIELVRLAHAELGLSSRLITLGQFLLKKHKHGHHPRLIDDLLEAGLTNVLFSFHAADEALFKHLTGGSRATQKAAMTVLDEAGIDYCSNTTVVEDNYRTLPDIAREVVRHNIYQHNFICMNTYHYWGATGRALGVQARYADIAPYLREAVDILEDHGVAVNVRYAPLCTVAGLEKNVVGVVGVRYDPYEWMNAAEHTNETPQFDGLRIPLVAGRPDPAYTLAEASGELDGIVMAAVRGHPEHRDVLTKFFPGGCEHCKAMNVCDGFALTYLKEHGGDEALRYMGTQDSRGDLLDRDRRAYGAAFFVKRDQKAAMRRVVGNALKPKPVAADAKVSVIVTCYNYGRYLRHSLDSALAQTWHNLEVILVDDGSTDDTPAIAAEYAARYPDRLKVVTQANSGQPAISRNNGILASTGALIVCLDADDAFAPTYVEEALRWLRRHPDCSIVYPNTLMFGDRNELPFSPDYDFGKLIMANFIPYCALYKREVWEDLGGYRTNVRGCEDWDFWIHAGGYGHFGTLLPRVLFNYRIHGAGLLATDVVKNHSARFRQIVLNNADLYPPPMVAQARAGAEVTPVVA
ncbi:MAG: glycosyltransferase [Magnetospirillum sp.]|nr:glycosyltransferase [Magnetospirillum sp.]